MVEIQYSKVTLRFYGINVYLPARRGETGLVRKLWSAKYGQRFFHGEQCSWFQLPRAFYCTRVAFRGGSSHMCSWCDSECAKKVKAEFDSELEE